MSKFSKIQQNKKDTNKDKKRRREIIAAGRGKVLSHVLPIIGGLFALLILFLKFRMVLLTLLARVTDGLPLSASIDSTHEREQDLQRYQNQAKQLFRKLSPNSPSRCTLESGPMLIHYQIEQGVCFLIICHGNFPKKLAFGYLSELSQSFLQQYSGRIEQASRPYSFIEFETSIRKLMKSYTDSRSPKQLNKINNELADVQRIMVQNIEDVIQRGEQLSVLDNKANNLSMMSRQYKKESHQLNLSAQQWKYIAAGIGFILIFLFLRYWVF